MTRTRQTTTPMSASPGLVFILAVVLLAPYHIVISQDSQSEGGSFTLNLKNADIYSLIETVSKRTGKNFIVDPRVNATVTVVSSENVGEEGLYNLFLSVLAVHGFAAVQAGSFVKIVPAIDAVQSALPTLSDQTASADDLITEVVSVKNGSAQQIAEAIRPLLPQTAAVSAEPFSNSLLITDRAANIERLIEIVRKFDRAD